MIPSDWKMECGLTGDSGENSTSESKVLYFINYSEKFSYGEDGNMADHLYSIFIAEVVLGAVLAVAVAVIVILSVCLLLIALLVKRRKSNAESTTSFVKMVEDSSEDERL